MTDITKCKGERCFLKEKCYRYTSKESEYQSWFVESPVDQTGTKCEMFWGEQSQSVMDQLNKILK